MGALRIRIRVFRHAMLQVVLRDPEESSLIHRPKQRVSGLGLDYAELVFGNTTENFCLFKLLCLAEKVLMQRRELRGEILAVQIHRPPGSKGAFTRAPSLDTKPPLHSDSQGTC